MRPVNAVHSVFMGNYTSFNQNCLNGASGASERHIYVSGAHGQIMFPGMAVHSLLTFFSDLDLLRYVLFGNSYFSNMIYLFYLDKEQPSRLYARRLVYDSLDSWGSKFSSSDFTA